MSWRSSSRPYSSYGSSGTMSSDPRAVENALRWIADEQRIHETSDFGENKKSVEENLEDQRQRVQVVNSYKEDVGNLKNSEDGERVGDTYKNLDAVAQSRLECLEGVNKIAGLEDLINKLSSEFSIRATQLVGSAPKKEGEVCDGVGAAAQNCVLAVRDNWRWISKLVQCTDIHLQNASNFHQFFHTAKEYEGWMASDLQKAQEKVQQQEEGKDGQKEAAKLLLELKEVLSTFLHWQGKIDNLFDSSKKVVPVPLRTKPLDYHRPVTALCNYKTKKINVREGEEMTLTDNSDPEVWKVRTLSFDESDVPSVVCLIPGPDADAVNLANKLRLQLLGIWTLNVKRIGKSLITFMLLTVKNFDDKETKKLKAIPNVDKDELARMLAFIEETLGQHWREYDGYKELENRNANMNKILSAPGNKRDHDPKMTEDLKQKLECVEELLKKYKDFWDYWETYKCLVQTSANPEYILIVDAWQQLKFLELAQLKKLWHNGLKLEFTDEDQADFGDWLSRQGGSIDDSLDGKEEVVETVEEVSTENLESYSNGYSTAEATMEREYETAETEQVSHMEQEEKKTFVITGVIDAATGEEVSMQKAVMLGIINSANGTYNDLKTGESMPIPAAMNAGLIKVEFTSTKRSEEKRRDIGLITIKTHKESRPYTVMAVIDAKTDKHLSVDEAISRGILDQARGNYYNTLSETDMSLADALDTGLLVVEFDDTADVEEPEIVTRTYAIHAVVDQRARKKVE